MLLQTDATGVSFSMSVTVHLHHVPLVSPRGFSSVKCHNLLIMSVIKPNMLFPEILNVNEGNPSLMLSRSERSLRAGLSFRLEISSCFSSLERLSRPAPPGQSDQSRLCLLKPAVTLPKALPALWRLSLEKE